jgi:diadenosine tetraphosphate (Ap4A) HIT family hydrolase
MALIYETQNFLIESHDKPHVSREDGGHIKISPKDKVGDVTQLSLEQGKEFMKLIMVTGEAMETVMKKQGIELGRINYQMNANFHHSLHMHLYGRGLNAVRQKFGNVLQHGPTREEFNQQIASCTPLTEEDVREIRNEIGKLLLTEKYSES